MIRMIADTVCVRSLTPRECFRLMGQPEEVIDKIMTVEPSKTRQYQMAGNSIVVDVLEEIFKEIYIKKSFGKCEKRPRIEDFYKEDEIERIKETVED